MTGPLGLNMTGPQFVDICRRYLTTISTQIKHNGTEVYASIIIPLFNTQNPRKCCLRIMYSLLPIALLQKLPQLIEVGVKIVCTPY